MNRNSHQKSVARSLLVSCAFSATMAAALAVAQEQNAAPQGEAIAEVVITGSRIAIPNATSTSPIQVVSEQQIKLQGASDMANLLNTLPQVLQVGGVDLGPRQNALGVPGGEATVDLRGLGPQRTLVLVNGRRLGPGDANTANPNSGADTNQIPARLVQRVEIVTGGASATYGSDAIGGVVNFIMKRDFEGVELDAQAGFYQHGNHNSAMQQLETAADFAAPSGSGTDGQNQAFNLIIGTNTADGRGNVTGYATYRAQSPVSQGRRDFAACLLRIGTPPFCGGSISSNIVSAGILEGNEQDYSVIGNTFQPYGTPGGDPPPAFNSSPYQFFQLQSARYLAGVFAHYDLSDWAKPYLEFNYMNDKSSVQTAPSGFFYGADPKTPVPGGSADGGALIPCNSALFSASQQAQLAPFCGTGDSPPGYVNLFIGRRNIEGGPRGTDWEHQNYRILTGIKGDLADAWNYDVYFSNYYTSLTQTNTGFLSWSAINSALNVDSAGNCINPSNSNCVPWQIFTQGAVTRAAADSLVVPAIETGSIQERIISGNITGDLGKYGVKLPTANDGVALNLGAEYRSDTLNFLPDAASLSNDLAGFGGAATSIDAKTHVTEEFAEVRLPLVQDRAFAHELVFDSGYRHSNYDPSGPANTYKFELQYAPVQALRLRGSYQHALRAPNIIELYNPQTVTNTSVVSVDRCAGANPTASLAECQRTGVSAAQYGHIPQCPAGQCATLTGGNPALKPEEADTVSVGITLTPWQNFMASVDYYQIKIAGEIGSIPLNTSYNQCLTTGDPTYCSLIVRSSTGSLFGSTIAGGGYIQGTNINVANAKVAGIDVQLDYRLPLERFGSLNFNLAGSYTRESSVEPLPGLGTYDCAGLYGPTCSITPRWRHNLRATWTTPRTDLLVSAQWRFIGAQQLDTNSPNPLLSNGAYDPYYQRIPSVSYLDLSAIWTLNKVLSIRAGINNLLDKDPPVVAADYAGTGSGNVFPNYDTLGREVFFGATLKF
jgi:outer membrane receptor protein involved in Fe transport